MSGLGTESVDDFLWVQIVQMVNNCYLPLATLLFPSEKEVTYLQTLRRHHRMLSNLTACSLHEQRSQEIIEWEPLSAMKL